MDGEDSWSDFNVEIQEACGRIEETLLLLEASPHDEALLESLAEQVRALAAELDTLQLAEVAAFSLSFNMLLARIRDGELELTTRVSDVVLLVVDRLRNAVGEAFGGPATHLDLSYIRDAIDRIVGAQGHELNGHIMHALRVLDPDFQPPRPAEENADLVFFATLSRLLGSRCTHLNQHAERIVPMALAMNEEAGFPVDPQQLEAAVLMHDLGMAFLPLELLNKPEPLTPAERRMLESHPVLAAELLGRIPNWGPAAGMVRQHHERVDGLGYPDRLAGSAITPGARIIAILDTFEAMTHQRAHRPLPRPFLRAVAEVNSCSGTQFDPYWVEVFNTVVRTRREHLRTGSAQRPG